MLCTVTFLEFLSAPARAFVVRLGLLLFLRRRGASLPVMVTDILVGIIVKEVIKIIKG